MEDLKSWGLRTAALSGLDPRGLKACDVQDVFSSAEEALKPSCFYTELKTAASMLRTMLDARLSCIVNDLLIYFLTQEALR